MKALPKILFPAIITLIFTACSATVSKESSDSNRLTLSSPEATHQVVLYLTPNPDLKIDDDWEDFREEWQKSMEAAANTGGVLFKFSDPNEARPAGPAIIVNVIVNDYRYVSQVKRYGMGVFVGNAFMDLDVQFIEAPSDHLLGTRKYSTTSHTMQGIFSAMTPKQVEAVAQEITKEATGK